MQATLNQPQTAPAGSKAAGRDIIDAIKTLKRIESEHRPATLAEQSILKRFNGFGQVALSIFPDPVTGRFKDAGWQAIGEELESLLTTEEYASARRTTFNAFYTSPLVISAMHRALEQLGLPNQATVLEPGCGTGNFLTQAADGMRFIGVELDSLSGRIAKALNPTADIRIENFRDTRLGQNSIDAVIGNVPFADVRLDYAGQKLALHDYFFAKSLDALKPGGVLALVTTHYTLDKQNAAHREQMASKADFLGAIRLPSDAFRDQGTKVVTDIVFLRKREPGQQANHADPEWLSTRPIEIEGANVPINAYFLDHPEMVLGDWSRKSRLYGGDGYSVSANGDLATQLQQAIARLPVGKAIQSMPERPNPPPAPMVTPPALPHLAEGSFFVNDHRIICQVADGNAEPVTYGGTLMKSDGTMTGRRLAALIDLRDKARRVLESQNEGWPESARNQARWALNAAYDRFTRHYGPINKTTFSETKDGGVIRRMPNLAKFREDPDAMLVMALEEYDELTSKATKAAILLKDVVGKTPPVTEVGSAEEGLLASLNQKGCVDLPFIATLYGKPQSAILEELDDLIYRDPESGHFETADAYLSGNVRAKLKAAESSGAEYARNIEALRAVQPEDVLPGDIDANLGSPWIPESDIRQFAAEIFGVPESAIRIGHLKKDALWSVDADYAASASVAASADYGTARINGVSLLEQALNLKTPVIYDTVSHGDREERVVNQEETLAAREKQSRLKERFRSWVFSEPERTERLVRSYNDTYNNLRPRLFDGSHLDFPGMNRNIHLNSHQEDAIWRGMSAGNTLLAHAVGAGKTFTMAATGMKMKQAGLIHKPMYVVPNHMLEQFGREFMQLYPNAKLLIASKEDFTKEKRKRLTARIAANDWDGIIVTHSSFERIGMSKDYQEKFLRQQIAEYDSLLCDRASMGSDRSQRNIIKTIEKQKARREEKLKDLLAEEKKDDGLVFDELGVDHLFVDEAHYFKNLETTTKMDRVAGIQTGGSERAFDLFMKARYLSERNPGHGVTFATGTPISNTMVELYTMQRFLDPEGLESRGLGHFDGWAATFGQVVDSMEISPDGASLKPRSRFARFVNLPELQQMFRTFADVQTAGMLDLPRPELSGGKPQIVACPMSFDQAEIQHRLIERYERIRNEKVDPREDNALAITTDGRKLALDARLISPDATDHPDSKSNALANNVASIWEKTKPTRGTQLIFCDMGVHPTQWGYSAYGDIIQKLTERGIPRSEIASIGDADTDGKKQALFDRVRSGSIRVLLGSTQKMGTGTNVQKRLVALHHADAPWKPAEVEQREGRIMRQGNENKEVAIYRYVTEGSFDAYMWQALETKAKFIGQVMTGDVTQRSADDIGGQELSYAEVKAIASGNPAVLTLAEADSELQRLSILRKNHADEQFLARRALRDLPETIARTEKRILSLEADHAMANTHSENDYRISGQACNRQEASELLGRRLEALPERVERTSRYPLGEWRGLRFGVVLHPVGAPEIFLEGKATRHAMLSRDHHGPRAVINAVTRLLASYGEQIETNQRDKSIAESQLKGYQARLGSSFGHEDYLKELNSLRDQLRVALSATPDKPASPESPTARELAERINELKSAHTIEASPERTTGRSLSRAEEPVTRRIRRRIKAEQPLPEAAEAAALPEAVEPPAEAVPVFAVKPESGDAPKPQTPELAASQEIPLLSSGMEHPGGFRSRVDASRRSGDRIYIQ
ncbi:DEAD/DEAH box helicase family protein [Tautonia sp. JC769]|uniref:DEAD/DEAH box helicase family protein n=1 Tax=Tautonia sp. JC769 TaxID=3232135 RepID=UPI003457AF52